MRAGTLVVDIAASTARLVKDMAEAKGVVAAAMNDISRSVNVAKTALGALGLIGGAGYLSSLVQQTIKATAALDDMAETTGSTVEALSKLQVVARIGGHDMSLVEDALIKLTKGLKGTEEETKNATAALTYLGVQAKTATGALRDPGEIMREVATRLDGIEDGAGKTALALDLFGRQGAKLLPFLKDVSQEGEVAARIFGQQSAAAEEYLKNLGRLQQSVTDTATALVNDLLPALNRVAEAMVQARKNGEGFFSSMISGWQAFVTGSDLDKARGEIIELTDRKMWLESDIAGRRRTARERPGFADAAKVEISAMSRELAEVEARLRVVTGYRDLLESEQNKPAPVRQPSDYRGAVPPPPATRPARAGRTVDEAAKAAAEALKSEQAALAASHNAWRAYTNAVIDAQHATRDQASELQFEIDLLGMSTAEADRARAGRRIDAELRSQIAALAKDEAEVSGEVILKLINEAEARKQVVGTLLDTKNALLDQRAAQEAAGRAAEAAMREWEEEARRSEQNISRTITDGLMRAFERDGQSVWQKFASVGWNVLRTSVVEPFLTALVSPLSRGIAGSIGGLVGGNAFAGSGGGGGFGGFGGIGGFPSPASFMNFGGALEFAGGLASGLGSSAATTAALIESGTVGFAGAGLEAAAGIGGFSSMLGPIGLGVAALGLLGAFGEGGGPKQQEVIWNNGGSLGFGDNNITSQDPAYYAAAKAATQDLWSRFTPEELAAVPRLSVTGEAGSDPFSLLAQLRGQVESALGPASQNRQAQAAMRESLLSGKDPQGYLRGQLAQLQAELGTSAGSIGAWRDAFLDAMEGPLSAEMFAKWQRLGEVIEQAGQAAGNLSTSGFRTLVDYNRARALGTSAPRFAGGGMHAGGWRLVGEMGPELEFTGPSRILSTADTREALGGGGAVQTRLGRLEDASVSMALNQARLLSRFEEMMAKGLYVRGAAPGDAVPTEAAA